MVTDPDDLVAWIDELQGRVARGELDGRWAAGCHEELEAMFGAATVRSVEDL